MNQLQPFLIIAAIPLFVVGVWCAAMIAVGRATGWIALAGRYRTTEPFAGQRWHFQSAQFRWGLNYSGALTVGADGRGLYLATFPLFRPGHPSLLIPWAQTKIEMKQTRWLGQFMEIQFPQAPGTLIRFGEKLAKRIAEAAGPELTT